MIHLLISEPSLLLNATINKIVQETLKEKNEFNFVSLDFLSSSLEDILENLQSSSLFDGKKIIIVKNPYFLLIQKLNFLLIMIYLYLKTTCIILMKIANLSLFVLKNIIILKTSISQLFNQ